LGGAIETALGGGQDKVADYEFSIIVPELLAFWRQSIPSSGGVDGTIGEVPILKGTMQNSREFLRVHF
jgi:hypothetical protein